MSTLPLQLLRKACHIATASNTNTNINSNTSGNISSDKTHHRSGQELHNVAPEHRADDFPDTDGHGVRGGHHVVRSRPHSRHATLRRARYERKWRVCSNGNLLDRGGGGFGCAKA